MPPELTYAIAAVLIYFVFVGIRLICWKPNTEGTALPPTAVTRSSKDGEALTPWELDQLYDHNSCPDCGLKQLRSGPEGGCCVNIRCHHCRSAFNVSYGHKWGERISDAHDIGKPYPGEEELKQEMHEVLTAPANSQKS